MNCDINNFDKLSVYCNEVKKLGFEIVRPDVNISETNFTVNTIILITQSLLNSAWRISKMLVVHQLMN